MTKFNDIYEVAADNHGLITSAEAKALGVSNNELVQYARRGKLEKIGHGLYGLTQWVPEVNDAYARMVAMAGPGAVLYGESVIAMLELAPTNPAKFFVAVPKRIRRTLPASVRVVKINGIKPTAIYDGIPCQSAADAIRACRQTMMLERLKAAAEEARRQGYILEKEYRDLLVELEG